MGKKITDKVTWVGKVDWELTKFHGDEYSVRRGSSYNSYLIRDEKTVLIDTVWLPFDKEFVADLKEEIDLSKIDYIIINHSEVDHSGALPELLREIPGTPIYCSSNGKKFLEAQYHEDWDIRVVKTGDQLNIGKSTLTFIEAPMLHWPDTMFTYMDDEKILFSNDAFGQHYATESLFNDTVDTAELYAEAMKYYANIVSPFNPMVTRKIKEVLGLGLGINMICTSHGVIWRDNPTQIVEKYLEWADNYSENQITIFYDTMWDSTRKMAEAITEGIYETDPDITVKMFNSAKIDKNDILTEIFRSKAVLVGSSTINNGCLYSVAGMVEMIKGFKFKTKYAAAFGSYGWSGESVGQLTEALRRAGLKVISDGIKVLWVPNDEAVKKCKEFGADVVTAINEQQA
ncbi:MAG: anaerobic nitric oxide reductase flavorubredoxin [Christensenellales bacterium]|jgi:anaerobic nitric oxide reductase flavorubredoxin